MISLRAAAQQHKAQFEAFLAENGMMVVVRQPAPRTSGATNDVAKMLGTRPATSEASVGAVQEILGLISGPSGVGSPSAAAISPKIAPLGKLATCDLILRVRLADALLDPAKPYGKTLFHTAKDIQVQGSTFEVDGIETGGLAPIGPYILWVGLKALGELTTMTHTDGERKIKSLQKEFLLWVEEHPNLSQLDADTFEDVRRRVFRATFQSFRLGVVGLDKAKSGTWKNFFGWLDSTPEVRAMPGAAQIEIGDRCFLTALEAFRVGALVSTLRDGEA